MSALTEIRNGMRDEWSRLQRQWQTSSGLWNDAVRERFEREFMQSYEPAVRAELNQLERLADVIAQAQREVK